MSNLLLTGTNNFLAVPKRDLKREAGRDRSQDVCHGGLGVRAKEGDPTVLLGHQDHSDHAARSSLCRQERLVAFRLLLAIERESAGLPTAALTSPHGQIDSLFSVDAWPSALTGWSWAWHAVESGIFA